MDVKRRSGMKGALASGPQHVVKGTVSQRGRTQSGNQAAPIKNAVAMQPTKQGYEIVKNARSNKQF